MSSVTIVDVMTAKEAKEAVYRINSHADEIARELIALRDREGWHALGYQSWTAFLESDELTYSRKRLLEFIKVFPVTVRLREKGYPVNTEQAKALAKYPDELQVTIYETVANSGKPVTADRLIARGEVYAEMVATGGMVTTRDGGQSAAESAYNAQREQQEIGKHEARKLLDAYVNITRTYTQEDGEYIVFKVGKGEAELIGSGAWVRCIMTEAGA